MSEDEHNEHVELVAQEIINGMITSIDDYYFATECNDTINKFEITNKVMEILINGDY